MSDAGAEAAPSLVFGRYRLIERIGEGGMAIVYRAVADGPGGFSRSFVVKRVRPELSNDPQFTKMLVAEARLSALLHHEGIVQVFELGQVGSEYYLAMEFVDGVDLVVLISRCLKEQKALPVGLSCYVISQLAAALAYAHDLKDEQGRHLGIVHRDISPSNVMVMPTGAVKLLDFGIAKAADHARDERTRTGRLKGKVSYLSPEQSNAEAVDRRSDIFSLGVVFYECLTMQRLFKSDQDLLTLRMVRECNIAPVSQVNGAVDEEVEAIVMKMLARDRADRYQSCEEVVSDLIPVIHRLQVGAPQMRKFVAEMGPFERRGRPVSGSDTPVSDVDVMIDPPAVAVTRTPSSSLPGKAAGSRAWMGALAGIAFLIAASSAWLLTRKSNPDPGPAAPTQVVPLSAGAQGTSVPPVSPSRPAPAPAPPPVAPALPATTSVTVRSDPPGATISIGGVARGEAPLLLDLKLPVQIVVTREGYFPSQEVVGKGGEILVKLRKRVAKVKPATHRLGLD